MAVEGRLSPYFAGKIPTSLDVRWQCDLKECRFRKFHGVFEATSQGDQNISPYAWTADGMDYTPYSAQ
ncbi:hypothetical protein SDJN02_07337, partial [Cucurbita argyrosperma subsp. argyrosperma]